MDPTGCSSEYLIKTLKTLGLETSVLEGVPKKYKTITLVIRSWKSLKIKRKLLMLKTSIKYRSFSWLKFPINKKKYRVERKQSQKDLLENYNYINFQEFKIQMVVPELEF